MSLATDLQAIQTKTGTLETDLEDIKNVLTEKGVEGIESIKISDVDEKIAEIQAGGGQQSYVVAKTTSLQGVISDNYSTLEQHKCFIVNEKAPTDIQTTDLSINSDNSVVCWIKDNDLYISSQSDSIICFNSYKNLFDKEEYFGSGAYDYNCPFAEIYCDNLSTKFGQYFNDVFKYADYLTTIDISNFEFHPLDQISLSGVDCRAMFYSCSKLKTIYANPWDFQESSKAIFQDCSSLPNWDSSKKGIEMCKYKEDGGYFTNPAERPK